jgi:hypothetical protein
MQGSARRPRRLGDAHPPGLDATPLQLAVAPGRHTTCDRPRARYASTHQGRIWPTWRGSYPLSQIPFRRSTPMARHAHRRNCRSRRFRRLVIEPLCAGVVAVVALVIAQPTHALRHRVATFARVRRRAPEFRPTEFTEPLWLVAVPHPLDAVTYRRLDHRWVSPFCHWYLRSVVLTRRTAQVTTSSSGMVGQK